MTDEFMLAHNLFGFNLYDFREVTITAIKSAFIHYKERKNMIRSIADELEGNFGLMPEYIEHSS